MNKNKTGYIISTLGIFASALNISASDSLDEASGWITAILWTLAYMISLARNDISQNE